MTMAMQLLRAGPHLGRLTARRAPVIVFTVIAGVALVQNTTGTLNGGLALLAAFYTLAVYAPGRHILAGVALLEGAAVVAALSSDHALVTWTSLSSIVTATLLTGYYVRNRRSYLASLVSRAERLERERDTQAQLGASAERARIAREMHDIIAHNILMAAIRAAGLPTRLTVTGQPPALPPSIKLALYRIIQEALTTPSSTPPPRRRGSSLRTCQAGSHWK